MSVLKEEGNKLKRSRQPQRWAFEIVDQIANRIRNGEELPFTHGRLVGTGWAKRFAQEGGFARKTRLTSSEPYLYNWSIIQRPCPDRPGFSQLHICKPGRARDNGKNSQVIEELLEDFSAWDEEHARARGQRSNEQLEPEAEKDNVDDVLKNLGYY